MAKHKLTKTYVDQLKANPTRRYDIYDENIAGLFIRVGTTGSKTFYLYYRNTNKRGRNIKLGRYGVITIAQARDLAKERLFQVYRDIDPSFERYRLRHAPTVYELSTLFVDEHVKALLKHRTQVEYQRLIQSKINPRFGKMKVEELKRKDIRRWHSEMKGTPREANFALAVLSKMMSFAINTYELRSDNPCMGVDRFKERKCERFLTVEELSRLGRAIVSISSRPNTNPYAVNAILILCLTGCRKTEILSLKWSYVDFERSRFLLPDSKTNQKDVIVGTSAMRTLRALPKIAGSDWVFPALTNSGHLKAIDKTWHLVRDAAGLEGVRLHDLRHTFASVAASSGVALSILGKVLGQTHVATTQRYAHIYNSPVETAVAETSGTIDSALSGFIDNVTYLKTTG